MRRRSVIQRHEGAVAPIECEPSGQQIDAILLEERRRRVREALARLPSVIRDALLLRFGEELRYDEMRIVLGSGESTLRSRVHHGLRQLKRELEKRS